MNVLLDILVVLIAAKLAAEVAERVGLPAVVGEILAGVLIGPSMLGLVRGDEVLRILGELGIILLLLDVGLQMDLKELGAVGRAAGLVATVGVVAPFALGWVAATALGLDTRTAIFLGAALTATSVGITARVFGDLRFLASVEARTVLGAAVVDDVMGLVVLTVVVRIVAGGAVSVASVGGVVALAVGFLAVTTLVGVRLAPPLFRTISRFSRSPGTLVAVALAFTLAFAELAALAKLAPIVGAFVAGLALARSDQAERIRVEITPVGHLFVPVFFLQIGIDADVRQFADPTVLLLASGLLVAAVVGKLVSPLGALGAPGDKRLIGLGMLPRGEVGLIFAGLGLREGVLGQDVYAALLLVVLVTTLLAPPLLRARLKTIRAHRTSPETTTPMPGGGWLSVVDGAIELEGRPGDHLTLHLALEASLLAAKAPPGPSLLQWFGSTSELALRWDSRATELLNRLLGEGNARSWRLLEAAGVLDRALPELADTYRRRRADPFELDPLGLLRWSLVDRVHELTRDDTAAAIQYQQLSHPEWLSLAALILETGGGPEAPVQTARQLVKRLDLGAAAEQEIAMLVGEHELLRAAAARNNSLGESAVIPIALHLERPERARALYLLSLALGPLDRDERQRLDELSERVLEALAHPELTGRPARNLVERRRSEAVRIVGVDTPAAARINSAPLGYLLGQPSEAVARQAALLDPVPSRRRPRLSLEAIVDPTNAAPTSVNGRRGQWRVELAARDQPGLLSGATDVLSAANLDVVEAVIATWPDGAALESFLVVGAGQPDGDALQRALAAALDSPSAWLPVPDAEVVFDEAGSPWCTPCVVRAADRPGLLHSIAAAFATAGANVHTASVVTEDGRAVDHFELTDRNGGKLDRRLQAAILVALAGGGAGGRRRLPGTAKARA